MPWLKKDTFLGDWSSMFSFSVQGSVFTGYLNPRDFYGSSGAELFTSFEFSPAIYQHLCAKGLVIQGYGLNLTKEVLVGATGISEVKVFDHDASSYMLNGVKAPKHFHGIIIQNGQKYMK